jgi:hypothetical protein
MSNLHHKPSLQSVAKAFSKSMNAQKIFFFISILSCLGKLFTTILNKRLNAYSDEFLLINESQVGFRQGYSSSDKVFKPVTLFFSEKVSKSFKYKENRKGYKISLCLTPFPQVKKSEYSLLYRATQQMTNIFSLYSLFEFLTLKKKKMFCAFIDFEKAFATDWREGLWCKLLMNNINGKMEIGL